MQGLTKNQKSDMISKDIKLIKKIAWKYRNNYIPMSDMMQEASIAYLLALTTYDSARGSLTTHVWHCISRHLINVIKWEQRHSLIHCEELQEWHAKTNGRSTLEHLSDECHVVVDMVRERLYNYETISVEDAKQHLVKDIREVLGFSQLKTRRVTKKFYKHFKTQ